VGATLSPSEGYIIRKNRLAEGQLRFLRIARVLMRVLYLTFDDLTVPYAWTVHVRAIVNRLVARGHSLRLVAPGGRAPGVEAPCDPLPAGPLHHVAGSLATFVRSGRAFLPDAVYVRGIHATITPALAASRLGVPLVVEVNGLLEQEAPAGWRRAAVRAAHRFTLSRAARVVTVAPRLRDALSARYRFPAERIDVVPNGADLALFRPGDRAEARRRLGLPADRPVVLCVASFYPHHAAGVLVEAARRAGAGLVLVGSEKGDCEGVRCVGPVPHDRVPDYVAAADVCATLVRAPGPQAAYSPLKLYEYMAGGRAVAVASDLEDLRAFVNANGIGLAVALDPGALSEAFTKLLADPEGRGRMGRRGRELAESVYNWDRAAADVERSLARALAGP
jgi:glycosyltransferase involved in cell wall biosynthesis